MAKYGGPHIVWAEPSAPNEYRIYYSFLSGATWLPPVELAGSVSWPWGQPPDVDIVVLDDLGQLLVTWYDEADPGLYGRVWDLTEWLPAENVFPGFGVGGMTDHMPPHASVHVFSHSMAPTCPCNQVYYARGTPGAWGAVEAIGNGHTPYEWEWPRELSGHATRSDRPHAVWRHESYDTNFDLVDERLIYATDGGDGWEFDTYVAVARNAHDPWVATDSTGMPALVWCDDHEGAVNVYLVTSAPLVGVPDAHTVTSPPVTRLAPNPTRHHTLIDVTGASGGQGAMGMGMVEVEIYDVRGRLVRRLGEANPALRLTRLSWDLRDRMGVRVAPGVYQVRVTTSDRATAAPLVVVR